MHQRVQASWQETAIPHQRQPSFPTVRNHNSMLNPLRCTAPSPQPFAQSRSAARMFRNLSVISTHPWAPWLFTDLCSGSIPRSPPFPGCLLWCCWCCRWRLWSAAASRSSRQRPGCSRSACRWGLCGSPSHPGCGSGSRREREEGWTERSSAPEGWCRPESQAGSDLWGTSSAKQDKNRPVTIVAFNFCTHPLNMSSDTFQDLTRTVIRFLNVMWKWGSSSVVYIQLKPNTVHRNPCSIGTRGQTWIEKGVWQKLRFYQIPFRPVRPRYLILFRSVSCFCKHKQACSLCSNVAKAEWQNVS